MKSFAKTWMFTCFLRCLLLGLFASVAGGQTNQPIEDLPIEDVVMPVEVYEDGTVKTRILAARAQIPAVGDILAVDAKIEFYAPDGTLESRVLSERFRFDRQKGLATSDGWVRYERKGITITGEGFEWYAEQQYVKILDDAKVAVQRRDIKGLGGRLGRSKKKNN